MRLIDLHWYNEKGEGGVKYSKIFNESHVIGQLDMLQDCIADLTDKYNELLAKPDTLKEKNHD